MSDHPRSRWPAAQPLYKAADRLRNTAPDIKGELAGLADPVADWLEEVAWECGWLAPFYAHEGGYRVWTLATRITEKVNGEPVVIPSRCTINKKLHLFKDGTCRNCGKGEA